MLSSNSEQKAVGGIKSSKKPVVSVITVTKNAEKYLEESLLSVINQTYSKIEYLIIDGLSDDGTVDILEKYRKHIDVLIREHDDSMYEAINKGICRSTGDIVAVLNADDCYADNGVVSRVVESIFELEVEGIYGDLIVNYGDRKKYKKVFQVSYEEYLMAGKGTFVPHITLFLKKSCLDRVGMYDVQYKYAADYDFILRCLTKCKIRYLSMPIAIFRRHGGSITASGLIRAERVNISKKQGYERRTLLKRKLVYAWLWGKYYAINYVKRLHLRCKI